MSAIIPYDPVGEALFSKNRRAILALLFGHADQAFYLREIVRITAGGVGAVQRELKQLAAAGLIRRTARGNQVHFQADPDCPVFEEIKGLVAKTAGVAGVLRAALHPLAERIVAAFIFGSIAAGNERRTSDVDVLIVGRVSFAEVVAVLARAQDNLRREVNPTVYPPDEFRSKMAAGDHFLRSVQKQPKIFLIGGEGELTRLAAERLVGGT